VTSIAAYCGGCSGDGLARLGRIRCSWSGIESLLEHKALDQLAFCAWNSPVLLLFWALFAGISSRHLQRRIVGLEVYFLFWDPTSPASTVPRAVWA
jgi:hypothetical protein